MTETLTLKVPSETDPKLTYLMHVQGEEITCSCVGFNTHGHCKHQDGVRVVLNEGKDTMTTETALTKADAPPAPIIVSDAPTALLPTRGDLEAMALIAGQAVKATGMIPKQIQTKEQALAVMIAGWELGLRPMTALRHVYVVNGKTEIETRAMVGIIKARRNDIQFSWPEYTQDAVTCVIARPGQPETKVRYTREDAKASGQLAKGGPWASYTRDMLYAAATKRACRLACPDLINAIETGLSHTVIEAAGFDVPEAEIRDVTSTSILDIPPDAYNEGDEPEAPPEPPEQPAKVRLQRFLRDARQTWDAPSFANVIAGINKAYPGALNAKGDLMITGRGQLDDETAQWILDGLAPQPPADNAPADVDAPDVEQPELI